jgi:hypothetical protein
MMPDNLDDTQLERMLLHMAIELEVKANYLRQARLRLMNLVAEATDPCGASGTPSEG